jgi:hypothetical protein
MKNFDDYLKFENRAKGTLTADGIQERYIDRRCKDYDKIDRSHIILSKDIHGGLVDTYGQFDLTELTYDRDNYDGEELERETGVKIEEFISHFDFVYVLEVMAEASLNWLMESAKSAGNPFEARVISIFAPSEYNYTTDDYEMEITKNPFDTTEELTEFLKSLIIDKNGYIDDGYIGDMIETIDMAVIDGGTTIEINGVEYDTLDDFRETLKK